ncbi:NfeD family protein [Acidianus sulfidivorans JP7]|uniref:Serine protease n=1 Tax=Acidianus sulfidivorans JP7 TaxID=619593 RepID=A0A2U9IKI2_9CREN|nr:NfeD family protein [Acidianus sulfidivorans]AWR96495.1 NfeD family protein [Acidianus sulfidivorans JP7]
MAAHIIIPIIIIIVLIIILVVTGYIADPIIDIPSLAIIGFLSYRMMYVIVKTRKRNLFTYIGKTGKAVDDIKAGKIGYVIVEGEYWKAIAKEDIAKGDDIIVVGMQDLNLVVKKKSNEVIF